MSKFLVAVAVAFAALAVSSSYVVGEERGADKPLLVIWQQSEYPVPGQEFRVPSGLVAAIWRDGRVIRATTKKLVGQTYIEGRALPKQFEELLGLLTSSGTLGHPNDVALVPDSASRNITIRHEGKHHTWTHTLPDRDPLLNDIETRTWDLPLESITGVDAVKANLRQFRDE